MKRLLLVPVFGFLLLAAAVMAVNFGLFHSRIEAAVAEKIGAKVRLGSTRLILGWPLGFEIGASTLESPAYTLMWRTLRLDLGSLTPPYKVAVKFEEPRFEWLANASVGPAPPAKAPEKSESSTSTPIALTLKVERGQIKVPDLEVSSLDLNFEQKLLLKSAAQIRLHALVEAKVLPVKLPLSFETDNLVLSTDTVKGTDLKVAFGGLNADVTGASLLKEGRHRWNANVSAPDLAKLPKPPMDIPAADWRGGVQLKAEILKEGAEKSWSAEGDVKAEKVSANVKLHRDKLVIQGPMALDLQSHFRYADGVPVIPQLRGKLDMTAANVIYQDVIQKAPGVAMSATVAAQGDPSKLDLQSLEIQFWKFTAKILGQTTLKAPYTAQFKFDVPVFSLADAEKVLLPLAKSPVTGEMGLKGGFSGNLMDAKYAHWQIEMLRLKDFAAEVDFDKPGVFKAKGPVKVSLEGRIEADKMALARADVKGKALLSEAALVLGPLRKEAKRNLNLEFQASNAGDNLELQNLSIDSFVGKMRVSGRVVKPFDPNVQLKVELRPLDLAELRMALPEWREKIPKGSLSGTIGLSGGRDKDKPWNDWPLNVDGNLHAIVQEYVMPPAPPAPPPAKPGAVKDLPKINDAFLPGGRLTSKLKMKILADVETFKKDKLTAKGIHVDGAIAAGRFKGLVNVREIFGGGVQLSQLDVPLLDPRPALQGALRWTGLTTEEVIGFAKPEYREFATGKTAGKCEFMTYLPADEEFLPFLKVKGDAQMNPVTLNSVKVGEMINDLIKKLPPAVKVSPVKVDPLHGQMNVVYDLQKQNLRIDSLDAKDVDNSELQLKGGVTIPAMQGDFAGTFFWAKPQVQGCLLEGNADGTGRMIVPVAIKGDLMHPGFASLSDLFSKLASKALACEQKKLVERVQKEGTKKLEEEVKKKLQGLFGH